MIVAHVGSPQLRYQPFRKREMIMINKLKAFLKDESGMETLEYAVIAGLIAAVAVVVYTGGWGDALKDRLLGATNPALPE
jgi:Flp pilus assembly pilin Flp